MAWARPWHGRVNEFAALHGIKLWSKQCVQQHQDLARYISSLEDQKWVKRLMQWQPTGRGAGGRPAHLWDIVQTFADGKVFNVRHWS